MAVGIGDGVPVDVGEPVGDGVPVGVGGTVGVGDAVGLGVGRTVGVGETVGRGETVGDGTAVGFGRVGQVVPGRSPGRPATAGDAPTSAIPRTTLSVVSAARVRIRLSLVTIGGI
ncbi:hypothetical protein ACIA5A_09825 [Micromonospora sp. NPDC051300]|uniref:hypothetical protein n=1 Tax=Micromonospora sp. NPDC051300 TaxID=3364286 RepID=UPI0037A3775D